jgi:succinate dehydrogenase/fumarate reductase flavoprotein subunit
MDNGSARTRMNVSNVLVIGSGAAGLRAAIAADEAGTEVVVIGKRQRKDAHTVLAAGASTRPLVHATPRTPGSSISPIP